MSHISHPRFEVNRDRSGNLESCKQPPKRIFLPVIERKAQVKVSTHKLIALSAYPGVYLWPFPVPSLLEKGSCGYRGAPACARIEEHRAHTFESWLLSIATVEYNSGVRNAFSSHRNRMSMQKLTRKTIITAVRRTSGNERKR